MGSRKYDDAAVLAQAKAVVQQCETLTDLANALNINRRTLQDLLKRCGYPDISSLMVDAVHESTNEITVARIQLQHYRKLTKRYEHSLANRAWLRDEIAGLIATREPVPPPRPTHDKAAMQPQVPVLLYSDAHFGLSVPPGQLGVFGSYSSDIAEARTLHAFRTFARIARMQPFPTPEARVYLLGDMVEHSHMRPGQAKQTDAHVVRQTIRAADVLSACLQFLCGEFERVEVHAVPGNHGRTTQRAGENLPDETYDHLLYYIIEKALARQENFSIVAHEAWYFVDEILGWKFLCLHGEDCLSWAGIPFYGIERMVKSYYMMLGQASLSGIRELDPATEMALSQFLSLLQVPDAVCIGHFHNPMAWLLMGVECVANGALSGVSLYSVKRLKRLTPPSQQMFFVHPEHCVGLRCPIKLAGVT